MKILFLQGGLYSLIAAFTSVSTMLASDTPLTARYLSLMAISAIVSGATALKAFLSTSYSKTQLPDPPQTTWPVYNQ